MSKSGPGRAVLFHTACPYGKNIQPNSIFNPEYGGTAQQILVFRPLDFLRILRNAMTISPGTTG